MDGPDRTEQEPESISVARCRELLGNDADTLSDEEVLIVARHAESLAHVVIQLFFPEGIAYDGNRFNRTAATAPLFNYLAPSESAEEVW